MVFVMKWKGDEAKRMILKEANNRLSAAGKHLRDAVKKNISIPTRTGKKTAQGKAIGKALKGKSNAEVD